MSDWWWRIAGGLIAIMAWSTQVAGQAAGQGAEPRVSPGLGTAGRVGIALLGPGVDYRLPQVAGALARDGEGDLIAFDFSDGDIRPFAASGTGTPAVLKLAAGAPQAQLVIIKEKPGDPQSFGKMMSFAARTPARIIVWLDASPSRPDWSILIEAVKRFGDRLFVVPLGDAPKSSTIGAQIETLKRSDNAVVVDGLVHAGGPLALRGAANVYVTFKPPNPWLPKGQPTLDPTPRAALVLAAMAARLLATEPATRVATLKETLITPFGGSVWSEQSALAVAPSR